MTEKKTSEDREQRLAKALRANLQRRKAQARQRRDRTDQVPEEPKSDDHDCG